MAPAPLILEVHSEALYTFRQVLAIASLRRSQAAARSVRGTWCSDPIVHTRNAKTALLKTFLAASHVVRPSIQLIVVFSVRYL